MANVSDHPESWLIVGASRGIGREFVRQLLQQGHSVVATVRDTSSHDMTVDTNGNLQLAELDVSSDASIENFMRSIVPDTRSTPGFDHIVINAGILKYPNNALSMSFSNFAEHLHTNTIGPTITAQKLLKSGLPIGSITFMSSDSGSATRFLDYEDGFAAYAASKAALNMALRHMAAELKRQNRDTTVLAIHPGEVATDMGNIEVPWEVQGVIEAPQSVAGMLTVIRSKGYQDSGTFWTWEGESYPW